MISVVNVICIFVILIEQKKRRTNTRTHAHRTKTEHKNKHATRTHTVYQNSCRCNNCIGGILFLVFRFKCTYAGQASDISTIYSQQTERSTRLFKNWLVVNQSEFYQSNFDCKRFVFFRLISQSQAIMSRKMRRNEWDQVN